MTLTPDKIELAQQIADALEEGIKAGPVLFFGSTYTKSDYCKNLIKPLLGKYHIDTLLESLPPHGAKKNNDMTNWNDQVPLGQACPGSSKFSGSPTFYLPGCPKK